MIKCDGFFSDQERIELATKPSATLLLPERLHIERCEECYEKIKEARENAGFPPFSLKSKFKKERTA